jgi:hypothetical protein
VSSWPVGKPSPGSSLSPDYLLICRRQAVRNIADYLKPGRHGSMVQALCGYFSGSRKPFLIPQRPPNLESDLQLGLQMNLAFFLIRRRQAVPHCGPAEALWHRHWCRHLTPPASCHPDFAAQVWSLAQLPALPDRRDHFPREAPY